MTEGETWKTKSVSSQDHPWLAIVTEGDWEADTIIGQAHKQTLISGS